MIKFVSIVSMLLLSEFGYNSENTGVQINEVKVEFSEKALGIESGQPIYSEKTIVWVSNPTETEMKIFINEEEKLMNDKRVEISGLDRGTYTLMIINSDDEKEKRTVGFTIQ